MELSCRQDLEALSRAVLAITEPTGMREVLQQVVESARTLADAEYSALGVPDETGRFEQFHAAGISERQWQEIGPVPRSHGLLGVMMRENRAQRLVDIQADPRFSGWPAAHPDMHAFLGVPIVDCDQILGAVYVANKRGGRQFDAEDEHLVTILAAHAALGLSRARMFERERELALAQERERIARDLHDAVAQRLFSLRLTVGAAEALAGRDPDRVREELARARGLAGSALEELRAVVTELRPPALREDGLVAALRKHVEVLGRAHPARVEFAAHEVYDAPITEDVEDVVFRIAQEALHNALRHSDAGRVTVTVSGDRERLELLVTDDGRGFEPDPQAAGRRHLGIMSMRERARRVGGRMRVSSAAGSGTTVRLVVPRGGARDARGRR